VIPRKRLMRLLLVLFGSCRRFSSMASRTSERIRSGSLRRSWTACGARTISKRIWSDFRQTGRPNNGCNGPAAVSGHAIILAGGRRSLACLVAARWSVLASNTGRRPLSRDPLCRRAAGRFGGDEASSLQDPREERHLGHRLCGQIEWETLTTC